MTDSENETSHGRLVSDEMAEQIRLIYLRPSGLVIQMTNRHPSKPSRYELLRWALRRWRWRLGDAWDVLRGRHECEI